MIKIFIRQYDYILKNQPIPVLKNIDIELVPGQITTMVGPSGCGKSTLLRVLMGIELKADGYIETTNKQYLLKDWNSNQTMFGLVTQSPHLLPWKNIAENILIAVGTKIKKTEKNALALKWLKVVGLEPYGHLYPHQISGGMASRVSFARTLATEPQALLLDEPFSSLDAPIRYKMQKWLLEEIKQRNIPALFITHDIREALTLGDTICVLKGKPAATICNKFTKDSAAERDIEDALEM